MSQANSITSKTLKLTKKHVTKKHEDSAKKTEGALKRNYRGGLTNRSSGKILLITMFLLIRKRSASKSRQSGENNRRKGCEQWRKVI